MAFVGYEVLGRVAQGSTGVVWQARQVELDRMVAIKELSPELLGAPGFLERFRAEARTLAGLDDPHVVRVFDYVEEPARAYLVQEWVDGAPLAAVLAQHGALTAEQGLGVLRGGLIGLSHAHSRGLVHRDISPANILLDRGGTSKLVDFGLAAQTDQGSTPGTAGSVGTPAFSSPEAVTGAPMTTRSDVYSAAAVLFLLLSGRLPYPGDTAQVLQAHASSPVPILDGHGPRLADLLARAMSKNPAQRPADAAAFLAELEQAATERYGAGWHDRASVAALVSTTAAVTGSTVLLAGSAAGPATAAQAATSYGALTGAAGIAGAATGHLTGTATTARTGARILGLPQAALFTILAVIVAAVVATTIILTNNNQGPSTTAENVAGANDIDGGSESAAEGTTATTASAPTTTLPRVPAFSGTYAVTQTYTAINGSFTVAVGETVQVTWQVISACAVGSCDVTIVSSSGAQFGYSYAGGDWTYQSPATIDSACFDANGELTGEVRPLTRAVTLTPVTPYDETSATPTPALSGTGTDSAALGCDGNPGSYDFTLDLVRTGD